MYRFIEKRKAIKKQRSDQQQLQRHCLEFTVPAKFQLSILLTEWIESQNELVMDLDGSNCYQWLNLWSVNFASSIQGTSESSIHPEHIRLRLSLVNVPFFVFCVYCSGECR